MLVELARPVWNGHSCPLPLTLTLILIVIPCLTVRWKENTNTIATCLTIRNQAESYS